MKLFGALLFVFLLKWFVASEVLPRHRRSYSSCGLNEIFTCSTRCRPTCEDRNPYCVQDCSHYGCQCRAGYVRQNERCVHVNECDGSRQCQTNFQCSIGYECQSNGICHRQMRTSAYSTNYQRTRETSIYSSSMHTKSCQIDIDCPRFQICLQRACVSARGNNYQNLQRVQSQPSQCELHLDCGNGNRCIDRVCRPASYMGINEHVQSGTTLCRTDRDCFGGKFCKSNICRY